MAVMRGKAEPSALVAEDDHWNRLCRVLLVRLFTRCVKQRLVGYTRQWHTAVVMKRLADNRPKRLTKPVKPKFLISGSVSPISAGKKTPPPMISSPTKANWAVKKAGEKQKGNSGPFSSAVLQRPSSLSPIHDPSTPLSAPAPPLNITPKPKDVGTRLFQQALEIQVRRANMRKSLEPQYPFTPRLAQNTERWLVQKPIKSAWEDGEVAVVSSATAVGVFGLKPPSKTSLAV